MPTLLSILGPNPLALRIANDTRLVEHELRDLVNRAEDPSLRSALHQLFAAGGKRLRPALVLLAAHWGSYDRSRAVVVGAAMEMIHAASLLHDDIVDDALLRRGRPTVNNTLGAKVAVLSGDYLFGAAARAVSSMGDVALMAATGQTIMSLCVGGDLADTHAYDWSISEADYFDYLEKKTASLTWLCCRAGALVANASDHAVEVLSGVGRNLGMAYQIVDDILDLTSTPEELGKPTGLDLKEGTITLPVIRLLTLSEGQTFRAELRQGEPPSDQLVSRIIEAVRAFGCVDYAYATARRYMREVERLVASLGDSDAGRTLVQVMRYAIDRRS
ncbi:MAG: polyprenyl synthetase family protein [Chloroflexi bacterium]|nr:polyprenyl synthetase family protein [Chloroflexota bacterium]